MGETHWDSFSNGECIRTGSEWKSKLSALNCKFEMCYQLGRGNKLLEQSIDKGENPVCYLQPPLTLGVSVLATMLACGPTSPMALPPSLRPPRPSDCATRFAQPSDDL